VWVCMCVRECVSVCECECERECARVCMCVCVKEGGWEGRTTFGI